MTERRSRTALMALCAALIALAAVLGHLALRAGPDPRYSLDIHLLDPEEGGDALLLMRFPLELAFVEAIETAAATGTAPVHRFLTRDHRSAAAPLQLDLEAYGDDFDGFVGHLLKDITFSAAGRQITPELGILSLVALNGPSRLPPGLVTTQAMLGVCASFPAQADLGRIDVVLQLYLPGLPGAGDLGIELAPRPPGTDVITRITDHRADRRNSHHWQGPAGGAVTLTGPGV